MTARSRPDDPAGPIVVVVTGSESTGKTTLARDLAASFGTVWVPEFARTYADGLRASTGRSLDASDVQLIARGHVAAVDLVMPNATRLVVLDTDLVSTVVYARHYYGSCPAWVELAAHARLGDLYLLCDIDVPWVPGPHRDRPHLREHLHELFVDALEALGARTVVIRGAWAERWDAAVAEITQLLSSRASARDPL